MRVALLQFPVVWEDKEANLFLTEQRIATLAGKADVAMLPEMFSTGFCVGHPELAEPADGPTMTRLRHMADTYDLAIVGSFICREGQHIYNRGFFVRPYEQPVFIDKKHLYRHGGEDRFFTAGDQQTVIEWRGVRFRLILCYDLRFPVWSRNRNSAPYDILLVVANWPDARIQYWDALIAARATENQCYIAAVNPVGDDGLGLHYNGHSVAYDSRLVPIASLPDDRAGIVIADFNMEQLHHFRKVLPLWQDSDDFLLLATEEDVERHRVLIGCSSDAHRMPNGCPSEPLPAV